MALKKVTIKRVFVSTANKEGIAYVYKNGKNAGKPFTRVSIQTEETGDEYYATNALPGTKPTTIKEGENVLLSLTEDNGFKNWNYPTKDQMAEYIKELEG